MWIILSYIWQGLKNIKNFHCSSSQFAFGPFKKASVLLFLMEALFTSFLIRISFTKFPFDVFLKLKQPWIENLRHFFIYIHLKHKNNIKFWPKVLQLKQQITFSFFLVMYSLCYGQFNFWPNMCSNSKGWEHHQEPLIGLMTPKI